jgi:hypothetical protein
MTGGGSLSSSVSQSFKTLAAPKRRLAAMLYTPISFAQKFALFTKGTLHLTYP